MSKVKEAKRITTVITIVKVVGSGLKDPSCESSGLQKELSVQSMRIFRTSKIIVVTHIIN